MDSSSANAWSRPEEGFDSMAAIGEQDFDNLVDLDFNSFDFLNFDPNGDNAGKIPNNIHLNLLSDAAAQHHGIQQQQRNGGEAQYNVNINMQMGYEAQHDPQYHMSQGPQAMQHHTMIPPTPNSVEMHSDAARYIQQLDAQSRAVFEQQYQMRKDNNVNFTPLGTPAVTPHDGQFNIAPEFTVPGAYFSPLTSPALEGQHQNGQHTSNSPVATSSPLDADVDMGESAQSRPSRRTRRRTNAPRTSTAGRKVAQSPIQKPMQRRKGTLSSVIPPKEVSELLEAHSQFHLSPTSPTAMRVPYSHASSSTDSISPEPLSEALMGPPPKPRSANPSPAISASISPNFQANNQRPSPATPASLMRLQQQPRDSHATPGSPYIHNPVGQTGNGEFSMLDELSLPESATQDSNSRPKQPRIDTANGEATPRLSARKTPTLNPLSISTGTARSTPLASAVASPTSGITSPVSSRRPELKSRASKKRGSVSSSTLASPALRPRISPSIKPLLPEGANLSDDARTLFLATRSNYQNLIEGTNLPGVSYPSDLPTQLTSKRTSHKIAEQGRRQRINIAISELQTLLPKSGSPVITAKGANGSNSGANDDEDDEEDDNGKKGGKGGGNSKAATVEAGIVYIKALETQALRLKQEKEEKDRELQDLKRKLGEMEKTICTKDGEKGTAVDKK